MFSIVVSFMSAIAILGLVAETYRYGVQAVLMYSPAFIIALVLSERLFVPWIYRLKLTSIYEVRTDHQTLIIIYSILIINGVHMD